MLARTWGLEGEIRLKLDEAATPTIVTPVEVRVGYSASFTSPVTLLEAREGDRGELVCRFKGYDTRESVEELKEKALFANPTDVRYEHREGDPGLIGWIVENEEGEAIGEIVGIGETAAHFIWSIDSDGEVWMLPAIEEFVVAFDEENRTVTARLIPGLKNLDESEDSRE